MYFFVSLTTPMFFMVCYIFGLGLYNFIIRRNSFAQKETSIYFFKTFDTNISQPPEYVLRVGRHFDNQFQLPMLFLITASLCYMNHFEDVLAASLCWLFVFSRILHTYVHLGSNHIGYRFLTYASGWVLTIFLWLLLIYRS